MESRPPNTLCFPAVTYLSLLQPLHMYTMTIGAVHKVVLEKEHIGTFLPYFWACRKDISAPRLTVHPSLEKVWVLKKGTTTLSRGTALGFSVSAPCSARRSTCLMFSRQRSFALRQLFSARLSQDDA